MMNELIIRSGPGIKAKKTGREFLFAHGPFQNHYRGQAAADDQAKQYGGRDDFKLLVVLRRMQAREKQFPKIFSQHEKPLVDISPIKAPILFNVHTFFRKYNLK
jgi:hypothetical protein